MVGLLFSVDFRRGSPRSLVRVPKVSRLDEDEEDDDRRPRLLALDRLL